MRWLGQETGHSAVLARADALRVNSGNSRLLWTNKTNDGVNAPAGFILAGRCLATTNAPSPQLHLLEATTKTRRTRR